MSDPISGGSSKVAADMLKEVQQALAEPAVQPQRDPAAFREVVEARQVDAVAPSQNLRARDVLQAAQGAQVRTPAIGQNLDHDPMASGVRRILQDVMQGQNKLGEIVNLALSGRNFTTPEMLALQAGVYRFSQEMELTSKVVEKSTATVKQVMNTQV